MNNYIIGFAYSKDKSKLALIKKNRPAWQEGLFNGIGGKLERFDPSPADGITREFSEETGVFIPAKNWKNFGLLMGPDYEITLFKTFTDDIFNVKSVTDEIVHIFDTNAIPFAECISNLAWIIPMSLETWTKHPDTEPRYEIYAREPEPKPEPKKKRAIHFNYEPQAQQAEAERTLNGGPRADNGINWAEVDRQFAERRVEEALAAQAEARPAYGVPEQIEPTGAAAHLENILNREVINRLIQPNWGAYDPHRNAAEAAYGYVDNARIPTRVVNRANNGQ